MFNATEILIDVFVKELQAGYSRTYGGFKPDYPE
ncbi:MAG: metal-dependent phosphohydrolase, partial [Okeania sp. SIO2H7]|nr:metal-dependent phosphohydrolase [Okeania sp. SIO2H7]